MLLVPLPSVFSGSFVGNTEYSGPTDVHPASSCPATDLFLDGSATTIGANVLGFLGIGNSVVWCGFLDHSTGRLADAVQVHWGPWRCTCRGRSRSAAPAPEETDVP